MMRNRRVVGAKAIVLGGFAGGASLCPCLCLAGVAFFVVSLVTNGFDDHQSGGPDWNAPLAVLIVLLALSLYTAYRVGWRVGQDWYRNGR
jgi:hypothetical protein